MVNPDAAGPAPRARSVRPAHAAIAALFVGAGVMHFVIPRGYAAIVPALFPAPLALVYLSGVCEILGGVGVLVPRTRRAAALGLVLLLAAVFPANVQMLANAAAAGKPGWQVALLWLRLPLQPALMWFVWRTAVRRDGDPRRAGRDRATAAE